mgnify:FL=1|jgi:hypothetical protein
MKNIVKIFLIIALFYSCKEKNNKISTEQNVSKVKINYTVDSVYNNYAQRVAAKDTTPFNDIDQSSLVSFYQVQNDKIKPIIENRLSLITNWNQEIMKRNKVSDSSFVFYPFSGADFIHAYYLYPNASEYFMSAIENIGDIVDVSKLNKVDFFEYVKDFDTVMRDIYMRSYFITKNMEDDFSKKTKINGVLPILLWSAAMTNHDIIHVKYFIVDTNFEKKYVDISAKAKNKLSVEIKLFDKTNNRFQLLNYYSADLSNRGLRKSSKSISFLKDYVSNASNGFVKSASYLMHYDSTFSTIQQLVLNKNKYFVQDDTGVPFKKFDLSKWNIELYGIYEKPIKDFSESLYQKQLDDAYKNSAYYKGGLKFSLGYHWSSKNQNQLVAIKK